MTSQLTRWTGPEGLPRFDLIRDADFAPAFERARLSGRLSVIELRLDPEALTPGATLTQTRDAALRARA